VDKKTSVISITVTDQDPLIAALIADSAKQRLQTFITNYRTNKARNDLSYMEKLYNEAKEQYSRARQLYASYSDANQELLLESYKSKEEDLENEMQLKYNIYTQVTEQLQLAKAKVQERTPAFYCSSICYCTSKAQQ
jgi:capsule polysaccharide export protein KpsE/RkpR